MSLLIQDTDNVNNGYDTGSLRYSLCHSCSLNWVLRPTQIDETHSTRGLAMLCYKCKKTNSRVETNVKTDTYSLVITISPFFSYTSAVEGNKDTNVCTKLPASSEQLNIKSEPPQPFKCLHSDLHLTDNKSHDIAAQQNTNEQCVTFTDPPLSIHLQVRYEYEKNNELVARSIPSCDLSEISSDSIVGPVIVCDQDYFKNVRHKASLRQSSTIDIVSVPELSSGEEKLVVCIENESLSAKTRNDDNICTKDTNDNYDNIRGCLDISSYNTDECVKTEPREESPSSPLCMTPNTDEMEIEMDCTPQELYCQVSSDICDVMSGQVDQMISHICTQCGQGCTNNAKLKQHMINEHGDERLEKTRDESSSNFPDSSQYSAKCSICPMVFKSDKTLCSHYLRVHRDVSNKMFSCIFCSYQTSVSRDFAAHLRKHTGERPFACTKCSVRCISRKRQREHENNAHKRKKHNKCPQCGESFTQLTAFKLHLQTHKDECPYVCAQCDKRFMRPKSLRVHIKYVHDRSFKIICTQCGKGYARRSHLNIHIIRHHGGEQSGNVRQVQERRKKLMKCLTDNGTTVNEYSNIVKIKEVINIKRETRSMSRSVQTTRQAIAADIPIAGPIPKPILALKETLPVKSQTVDSQTADSQQDSAEQTTNFTRSIDQQATVSLIEPGNSYNPEERESCCICQETFESETILHCHYKSKHYDKSNNIISCVLCTFKANYVVHFIIHGRTHTGEKPYMCAMCDKRFSSQKLLGMHVKCVHRGVKRFRKCPQCGEKFKRSEELTIHRKTHEDERPYVCEQCNKRFMDPDNLTNHVRYVHVKLITHVCTQCGQGCISSSNLNRHMKNQHGDKHPMKTRDEPSSNFPDSSQYSDQCAICPMVFKSESSLRSHYLLVHLDVSNKTLSCIFCSYQTKCFQGFLAHLRLHTGERPFVCTQCGVRCISGKALREHENFVHQRKKHNKCSQCGKSFTELTAFKLHRQTHKDERPYVCAQCDKRFMYSKRLRDHIKYVHDRSFKNICPLCGEGWRSRSELSVHIIRHHGGERPFLCTVCGEKNPTNYHLKKHAVSHSENYRKKIYPCSQCDKSFTQSRSRTVHIKTVHSTERPYECVTCGKKYKLKAHLETHRFCHTGERPYACKQCDETFVYSIALYKHKYERHDVEIECEVNSKNSSVQTYQTGAQY